eukprot:TRINITY_DN253_c0_g3_i1.p1 TRINITY_DN253_c0_g3~~TRINITY_DN253_c0_g3_i1.p1  ORF type:complete len:248 (-),score=154.44 TRINITY_DN253_c0_g3_i1:83-826(-)
MDYNSKWGEVTSLSIDNQTKFFLRAFVLEFQGNFEQVLDIAAEFKSYIKQGDTTNARELGEFDCHLFLEKRGETLTVKALRENLKSEIRLAPTHNVAFVEYLLWKYNKSLNALFTPPPAGSIPPEILQALDQAIDAYNSTKAAQLARLQEIEQLKETATSKRSVASVQAQNKIDQLSGQEFSQKFAEMRALKAKKEAEAALANAPKVDPYELEQKRLAEEEKRKKEEALKLRADSRARLAARSNAFK